MLIEKVIRKNWFILLFLVAIFYVLTHVWALTKLPVFADEAIYIRWSQLIIDDWRQYLFFPLNDGKTPLQMWLMVPFLSLFSDPLFAGRALTVLFGLGQIFVIKEIIKVLHGGKVAQLMGILLSSILPFWFFFHRMALIDGILTFFLSLTFLGIITLSEQENSNLRGLNKFFTKKTVFWMCFTGVSFGLALWTKPSAIFFATAFPCWLFLSGDVRKVKKMVFPTLFLMIAGALGIALFLLLKLNPAFGQLFGRGKDFAFTVSDLMQGEWKTSIDNFGRVFMWNVQYFTIVGVIGVTASLFFSKNKQKYWALFLTMLVFIAPLVILGRVFHPRYIFPMTLFSTTMLGLFFEELWLGLKSIPIMVSKKIAVLGFSIILIYSAYFMMVSWFNPNQLPLVGRDREQYLEEWSSGHGVFEIVQFIEAEAIQGRVVVATEGYFGTLPDGILLYFHNKNVDNIEIYGIGQPITEIPDSFIDKSQHAQKSYIVVNSHRMKVQDSRLHLIHSYPRPNGAPSLDIYEFVNE